MYPGDTQTASKADDVRYTAALTLLSQIDHGPQHLHEFCSIQRCTPNTSLHMEQDLIDLHQDVDMSINPGPLPSWIISTSQQNEPSVTHNMQRDLLDQHQDVDVDMDEAAAGPSLRVSEIGPPPEAVHPPTVTGYQARVHTARLS